MKFKEWFKLKEMGTFTNSIARVPGRVVIPSNPTECGCSKKKKKPKKT